MSTRDRLPVRLGDRKWMIEIPALTRREIASYRSGFDTGQEAGEQSLANESIWRRTGRDWVLGAGQLHFDEPEESTRRRFRTSLGINPWERRALTLLPSTRRIAAQAATNQHVLSTEHRLWHGYGTTLRFTANPRVASPAWTTVTGLSSNPIVSLTDTGSHVYIADGSTLRRVAIDGTAATTFGSLTPTLLGYAVGRLIAADGNEIYEIAGDGSKKEVWTHPSPDFTWDWICGTLNGIYVGGHASDRSEVYLLSVVDATGDLAAPYPVLPFPSDEIIHAVEFYAGYLILATSRGVRLARIQANGFLAYGPLREIGEVRCLASRGEFVWFGWSNIDPTHTGLGRLALARFTSDLTPAFASDLMTEGQGTVTGVVSHRGHRYYVISGDGLHAEHPTDLVESGWLRTGSITYGTPERKAALSIEGRWSLIPSGASVTVAVEADTGVIIGSLEGEGLGGVAALDRGDVTDRETEEYEVVITLTRGTDPSEGPELHRWTLRVLPMPFLGEEIFVPLMLEERVHHDNVAVSTATFDDFMYVKHLRDSRTRVPLHLGREELTVYVSAVLLNTQMGRQWSDNNELVVGVYYAKCVTVEAV